MRKVFRANTYFFIILLLQLFLPVYKIFQVLGIHDIRIMLLINHTVIFLIPAVIFLIVTKQSPKKVLKLNKLHFKDGLLIILLAFVCQPIMMFFSLVSQFFFENEIGNFVNEIVTTPYLILLLLVAVLPAITEEITIRGVILSGYEKKNTYVACIATGLLFGIMHLDPQQFLYASVLGGVLALLVRLTNSIFSASLLHFLINGTSVTLQKIASGFTDTTGMLENAENSLRTISLGEKLAISTVYGGLAIVFSVLAYLIIKKIKNNNIRRGIIVGENTVRYSEESTNIKDNVINLPFIAIIVIYILVMFRQILL